MAERTTAEERLARVLEILPYAAQSDGVALDELATTLDMSEAEVLRDLAEVYTREFYHPAGSVEDVQVLIEADRVTVWTTGEFRRPPRLGPGEALALGLGLRILAAESPEPSRPELIALAERLEGELASESPVALMSGMAINPGIDSPEGIRAMLNRAARERTTCDIGYLKPGAAEPEQRAVDPYTLLNTGGRWYLVGYCHRAGEVRVFRADRVIESCLTETHFTVPDDFDPALYVHGGRVFRSGDEIEAIVRYSPRIARWIEEQGPVEREADGSVVVRYPVADPDWLVRHVLEHGAEAEILAPPAMRETMRDALREILAPR